MTYLHNFGSVYCQVIVCAVYVFLWAISVTSLFWWCLAAFCCNQMCNWSHCGKWTKRSPRVTEHKMGVWFSLICWYNIPPELPHWNFGVKTIWSPTCFLLWGVLEVKYNCYFTAEQRRSVILPNMCYIVSQHSFSKTEFSTWFGDLQTNESIFELFLHPFSVSP
jgi:hypothetical protein